MTHSSLYKKTTLILSRGILNFCFLGTQSWAADEMEERQAGEENREREGGEGVKERGEREGEMGRRKR